MESLQVSAKSADSSFMERDYQLMGAEERLRHHDDLRDEGFEWCPECGSALVWELPQHKDTEYRSNSAPIVAGDYPPLTRDQLLMTVP
jgi:hypothetical protein